MERRQSDNLITVGREAGIERGLDNEYNIRDDSDESLTNMLSSR